MASQTGTPAIDAIRWNSFYSVGDARLDDQHQEILFLVNRLYEILGTDHAQDNLPTVIRRLADYTCQHFQDEEVAMERVGFPHLDEHRRLHKQLKERTFDLQFRCLQRDLPDVNEVLRFLKTWWLGHITGVDKQYTPYLLAEQADEAGPEIASAPDVLAEEADLGSETAELLDALIENERQVGCYYEVLETFLPKFKETWHQLARQEESHAVALVDVRRAVARSPRLVSPGRFTAAAARTMTRDIREMIARIERGEVHPRYAVSFITDIEQSLLEHEIDQAVKTDVPEIRDTLQRLKQQTRAHRGLLHGIVL